VLLDKKVKIRCDLKVVTADSKRLTDLCTWLSTVQSVLSHMLMSVEYTQSYDDVRTQLISLHSTKSCAESSQSLAATPTFFEIQIKRIKEQICIIRKQMNMTTI